MTLFPTTTTTNNNNNSAQQQQQSPRNNINNNINLSSSPARLTTILAEALEIAIHELLYIRNIYPSDTFKSYRYLDVKCHGCRHPDVIDYIADVLRVAVPSLCSGGGFVGLGGGVDEIVWERFCFEFDPVEMRRVNNCDIDDDNDGDAINYAAEGNGDDDDIEIIDLNHSQGRQRRRRRRQNDGNTTTNSKRRSEDVAALVKDLEFGLRQLILRIITLEGSRRGHEAVTTTRSPNVTFKLCLRTTTAAAATTTLCDELDNALKEGQWFQPDRESCELQQRRRQQQRDVGENKANSNDDDLSLSSSYPSNIVVTRPLKSLCVPSCGIRMQLLMEVKSDDGV